MPISPIRPAAGGATDTPHKVVADTTGGGIPDAPEFDSITYYASKVQHNAQYDAHYQKARRRFHRLITIGLATILLGLCILGIPIALRIHSNITAERTVLRTEQTTGSWSNERIADELRKAHEYNRRLATSDSRVLGESVDPFVGVSGISELFGLSSSDGENGNVSSNDTTASSGTNEANDSASEQDSAYMSLLDTSNGIMGSIVIPKISVNLPIYHGTTETALGSGIGHLYGTSMPVGGPSTHAVLTGHRGLVQAMMFTRLDEMTVGDTFSLHILNQRLTYRVDRITVIEPNDFSQFDIVPGEDRVTLMTCTPYGLNTHRLLVSGVRVLTNDKTQEPQYDRRTAIMWAILIVLAVTYIGWWTARQHEHHSQRRHWSGK